MSHAGRKSPAPSGFHKKKEHKGPGEERWLLTYADLITLLLVFFIVLYAISKVDQERYSKLAQYLKAAFNGGNMIVDTGMGVGDGISVPLPNEPKIEPSDPSKKPDQAYKDLLVGIGEQLKMGFAFDGRFTVSMAERGLVISLAGSAAFDSGRADLKPEFLPLLEAVTAKVGDVPNDISIEGHTDTDPINTAQFPSNWELSTARANAVRSYLRTKGVNNERMIVVGYGETRPSYSNATAEGKAKNRRVDVVILRNKQVPDLGQEIKQ